MASEIKFQVLKTGALALLKKANGAKCAFLGRHPESRAMMILSSTDDEDAKDEILVETFPLSSESLQASGAVMQFAEAQNPFSRGVVFIREYETPTDGVVREIGAVVTEVL